MARQFAQNFLTAFQKLLDASYELCNLEILSDEERKTFRVIQGNILNLRAQGDQFVKEIGSGGPMGIPTIGWKPGDLFSWPDHDRDAKSKKLRLLLEKAQAELNKLEESEHEQRDSDKSNPFGGF